MFANKEGRPRPDAERIGERAAALSDEEIGSLHEREQVLRDVVNSFAARIEALPERDRKAMLCLFYGEMADVTFDFRLSLETRLARQRIAAAKTRDEKRFALRAFQSVMRDVAMIHGIE